MFDVGFTELMVIALVGLIVIGPERMPKVARMVGHLLGRLQRYVGDVKADINREMQLDELKKLQSQVVEQTNEMERQVSEQMSTVEASLNQSILSSAEITENPENIKNAATAATDVASPTPPPPVV